ncbi:MAG TPA: BadF/BadG/BcrA/BcrD ATPase family protein [Bacteroidota bacterium]
MSDTLLAAGIDGGATRTRAVLVAADGTIAGFGTAGPSNYDNVGEAAASENIRDAVGAARRDSGRSLPAVASMFLGMAGVVSRTDRETVRRMVLAHALAPPEAITVDHDIRIALAGGLEGREGIVLIAGTGSSTYGRRSDGRNHRTGWGFLLDDRGSGYFLGLQAMIATVMEADGRGSPTVLSHVVRERFRFSDIDDILRIVYHDRVPVAGIASLAPDVIGAAGDGDGVAERILEEGAREITRMVAIVAERVEFSGEFPVTMTGGLVDHPGLYRDLIHAGIRREVPGAAIVAPSFPPVIGAALLALEGAGVPPTGPLVEKLKEQVRLLPAVPGDSQGNPSRAQ